MADDVVASAQVQTVSLTKADIPGTFLCEPMASHTTPHLRWWLLCRGMKAPTSWYKQKLLNRFVENCFNDINCIKIRKNQSIRVCILFYDTIVLCRIQ